MQEMVRSAVRVVLRPQEGAVRRLNMVHEDHVSTNIGSLKLLSKRPCYRKKPLGDQIVQGVQHLGTCRQAT